jgi:adenosylhomocysteine nucleosidase
MGVRIALLVAVLSAVSCSPPQSPAIVVVVSANAEWAALKATLVPPPTRLEQTPFGECFVRAIAGRDGRLQPVRFFHGGWGKIDAAASAQYAIMRWNPALIVNIGTAGGFAGKVKKGQTLLVTRTVTYDIYERMGDSAEAIAYYSSAVDAPPLSDPAIRREVMISGDRDIDPAAIPELAAKYGAVAADWESSAIAHVAKKNHTRLVILRGVSDVVGEQGSETYGNLGAFEAASRTIMKALAEKLPLLM